MAVSEEVDKLYEERVLEFKNSVKRELDRLVKKLEDLKSEVLK